MIFVKKVVDGEALAERIATFEGGDARPLELEIAAYLGAFSRRARIIKADPELTAYADRWFDLDLEDRRIDVLMRGKDGGSLRYCEELPRYVHSLDSMIKAMHERSPGQAFSLSMDSEGAEVQVGDGEPMRAATPALALCAAVVAHAAWEQTRELEDIRDDVAAPNRPRM